MTGKNIIQQLVRVFEVKRLTTSKLHDVRRLQLHSDYVASVNSRYAGCETDHPHSDHQQRALTRRLVYDFNSDSGTQGVRLRADENQLTDVKHFEKYLRCESISYI